MIYIHFILIKNVKCVNKIFVQEIRAPRMIKKRNFLDFFYYFKMFYKLCIGIFSIVIINLNLNHISKIVKADFILILLNQVCQAKNIVIIIYWAILLILSIFLIEIISNKLQVSKTIKRKFFHFLICLIYLPGLKFMDKDLLLLISVLVLYTFLFLEVLRGNFKNKIFESITEYLIKNIDERDDNNFILTHTFLLFGCFSSFLFEEIQNFKKYTNNRIDRSAYFIGLITLGIGDAFVIIILFYFFTSFYILKISKASIIGSKLGRNKIYNSSQKTLEGTLAGIISAIFSYLIIILFFKLNLFDDLLKITLTMISAFLYEGYTLDIDNFLLPIFSYKLYKFIEK